MVQGRSFHILGAAAETAQSLNVFILFLGHSSWSADLKK